MTVFSVVLQDLQLGSRKLLSKPDIAKSENKNNYFPDIYVIFSLVYVYTHAGFFSLVYCNSASSILSSFAG
jgi:hypothetical protein